MFEVIILLLVFISVLYLLIWFIKQIIRSATNTPTWQGIIISAVLGMLPFYLVLCFFGFMGEERDRYYDTDSPSQSDANADKKRQNYEYDYYSKSKKNRSWIKYLILAFIIFLLLIFSISYFISDTATRAPIVQTVPNQVDFEGQEEKPVVEKKQTNAKRQIKPKKETEKPSVKPHGIITVESAQSNENESHLESTDDKIVERQKTTLELIEEQNHASVVKQAKEAGVSAEGSTMEILERINHASVVKQAKEAGVSAEGSTLEILERINHANVVKQAKEAGVSAEGSTLEILERIHRKQLEEN